jgi:hypothetical protein
VLELDRVANGKGCDDVRDRATLRVGRILRHSIPERVGVCKQSLAIASWLKPRQIRDHRLQTLAKTDVRQLIEIARGERWESAL